MLNPIEGFLKMTATMQAPRTINDQNNNVEISLSDAEIMARVARIKRNWSEKERAERAETGRHRRHVLAALVESAMCDEQSVAAAG